MRMKNYKMAFIKMNNKILINMKKMTQWKLMNLNKSYNLKTKINKILIITAKSLKKMNKQIILKYPMKIINNKKKIIYKIMMLIHFNQSYSNNWHNDLKKIIFSNNLKINMYFKANFI